MVEAKVEAKVEATVEAKVAAMVVMGEDTEGHSGRMDASGKQNPSLVCREHLRLQLPGPIPVRWRPSGDAQPWKLLLLPVKPRMIYWKP